MPQLQVEPQRRQQAIDLAVRAVEALQLRAASVDVVWSGGVPRVLEVNTGIMVESLARSGPEGAAAAQATYRAILDARFGYRTP
ncbi:MAG: hypothetical protein HY854_25930 [Burkholderiales bacterium]|nr:hypothetical protein [Burkholderiales bacterium]